MMCRATSANLGYHPWQVYKGDTRNSNDLDPQMFEVSPLCFFESIHRRPVYGLYISAMIETKKKTKYRGYFS
jgi:hypothetical protein